jgi:hypothetical protein
MLALLLSAAQTLFAANMILRAKRRQTHPLAIQARRGARDRHPRQVKNTSHFRRHTSRSHTSELGVMESEQMAGITDVTSAQ